MSTVKTKTTGSSRLIEMGKNVTRALKKHDRVETISSGGLNLYIVQYFMTEDECRDLIALIDAGSQPSTLYAGSNNIAGFRTSDSCNLDPYHPLVARIEARICGLMGVDRRYGETLQGQRYQVGQQFKPHYDYFFTDQDYWEGERISGGQRSWTAMIYLNEPINGGQTNFPNAGMSVSPRTAMLVIWNNMDDRGLPDIRTLHEGGPVTAGTKYIVTKWFRARFWGQAQPTRNI